MRCDSGGGYRRDGRTLNPLLLAQESTRTRRRWRGSAPGAALTVLGWAAATGLLPAYVTLAANFSPTLGSLGGGLIVLAWLYLLTISLFLGAELNAVHENRSDRTG